MIGIRLLDALKDVLPFALISMGVMAVTWLLTTPIGNIYLLLGARIVVAALLYTATMKLLRVQMMNECMDFILKKKVRS